MKSYQECKMIAIKKSHAMKETPDKAFDYGNAYLFTKKNYTAIGGALPIVVLKEDGKAVSMTTYVNMYDEGSKEKEIDFETGE